MRLALGLTLAAVSMLIAGLMLGTGFQGPREQPGIRFEAVDVFVDAGSAPLAAWQVQVKAVGGEAKLVGIEGGDGVYKDPPYYDPAALHESQVQDRVVIAAFSTAGGLPTGKVRVARLHLQTSGGVEYQVKLMTAGAADGSKIEAKAMTSPAAGGPGDGR